MGHVYPWGIGYSKFVGQRQVFFFGAPQADGTGDPQFDPTFKSAKMELAIRELTVKV